MSIWKFLNVSSQILQSSFKHDLVSGSGCVASSRGE